MRAGSPRPRPQVWAVGGNSKGQLGQGTTAASSFLPCSVAFQLAPTQRVVEVFCGYEHTFALTSDGDVLGFGNGGKGQLGIGNTDSPSNPQRVHLLSGKGVVMMAAGLEHSLALTDSGDLYAFGDNLSGQLGLGHNFTAKEQTPQKVPNLSRSKITQLACGQDHTAVLTSSGELFMFGNNRTGALGLAGHANEGPPIVASAPQWVAGLKGKRVVQIGCGLQHTVALTAGGSVYCWGENGRGQLGTGDTHNKYTPSLVSKPLSSFKCIHVACGGQHTICVTDTDDVYGFGSDRHGQLGLGKQSIVVPVPSRIVRLGGRRVKNCIGGAWHTIIGTVTGEQYLMGCILPSATPQAGGAGAGVAASRRSLGAASASDPFALSCGEFRRLLLPQGAEACSKGHSLFYGQGLGPPPSALRKVVKSLGRLKSDFSRMLVRQEADVVFTPHPDTEDAQSSLAMPPASFDADARGLNARAGAGSAAGRDFTVGAHLAVVRARCPSLYKHVVAAVSGQEEQQQQREREREEDADGRVAAWRVCSPAGVPIDALQLVICYLYQGAGVFEKQKPETETATQNETKASTGVGVESSFSFDTERSEPEASRARDRRDHMRSRAGLPDADTAEELTHCTVETSLNPWDDEELEAAAGFGSFGGAYGSDGTYDGAGLDRLMRLMSAARTLKLTRLQGLCEKRAEAFIDYRTVHKVLRRAAEGGFPYLKRRCLEFCLMHLSEVCAPGNSTEVVRELSKHPQVLADVLSLSAASDEARLAAASEEPFEGAGSIPCIEALRAEAACPVSVEDYEASLADFLALFERRSIVADSVAVAGGGSGVQEEAPGNQDGQQSRQTSTTRATGGPVASFGQAKGGGAQMGRDLTGVQGKANYENTGVHLLEAEGDFKIRAGEGLPAVTVHKSILAARSGFFRALLESGMGDARHGELTLKFEPVVGMSALLEFLRFLYTGRSGAMDPLTALEVLFLTKGDEGSGGFFQVVGNDELRAFCTSTLFNGFNSDNALPILVRAKALGDEPAVQSAIDFILQNFDDCMASAKSSDGLEADAVVVAAAAAAAAEKDALESNLVPACLEDDESPAVDLLLALAKRCSVKMLVPPDRPGVKTEDSTKRR